MLTLIDTALFALSVIGIALATFIGVALVWVLVALNMPSPPED
jgi:hypothetical protein